MTVFLMREKHHSSHETKLIYQYCLIERIPTKYFDPIDLINAQVNLTDCRLVVGSVQSVSSALQQLSKPVPVSDYYPTQLHKYLYRDVWRGNITQLQGYIINDQQIFAKPVDWKLFTGMVFDASNSYNLIEQCNKDTQLWFSDPVVWVSEYRIYVLNNQILAISLYQGDSNVVIDMNVINDAIKLMESTNKVAYSFDWGVLNTGQTALVEMNDAWAIGEYGDMTPKQYYEFLLARWNQMVKV